LRFKTSVSIISVVSNISSFFINVVTVICDSFAY
jgi:hypothetical protein